MKTHPARLLTFVYSLLLCGVLGCVSVTAYANETTQQIRFAAKTHVEKRLSSMVNHPQFKRSSTIKIKVGKLDPRLQLALCEESDLKITDHSGSALDSRYLLKVSCNGVQPWSLFIPVSIVVTKPVVVATQSVSRGSTLTPEHLQLVDWEVSKLRYGYFQSLDQAVGRLLRKPISSGMPMLPDHLGKVRTITKGDEVLIEASKGPISVKSPGIALSNGTLGEQINVRNRRSKKVIRATVVGAGHVSVPM